MVTSWVMQVSSRTVNFFRCYLSLFIVPIVVSQNPSCFFANLWSKQQRFQLREGCFSFQIFRMFVLKLVKYIAFHQQLYKHSRTSSTFRGAGWGALGYVCPEWQEWVLALSEAHWQLFCFWNCRGVFFLTTHPAFFFPYDSWRNWSWKIGQDFNTPLKPLLSVANVQEILRGKISCNTGNSWDLL